MHVYNRKMHQVNFFLYAKQHFFSEVLKEKSIQKVVPCDSFDKL